MMNTFFYILGLIFGAILVAVCVTLILIGLIAVVGSLLVMAAFAAVVVFLVMAVISLALIA